MRGAECCADTNVLLYLISPDRRKAERAQEIVDSGVVASVQALNEFVSVAVRKYQVSLSNVRIALTPVISFCRITAIDLATHLRAFDIAERHQINIYDSLMIAAAELAGCRWLLTEDLNHGQRIGGVTIRNPFV